MDIALWGLLGIIWLYVAARVVTRGVLRSLSYWRAQKNGQAQEQEEKGTGRQGQGP